MVIAACELRLRIPESRSLKDKRRVVCGLLSRLRERFNVSAIEEPEGRDGRQTAVLGLALAARDRPQAESQVERIRAEVETSTGLKYFDMNVDYR